MNVSKLDNNILLIDDYMIIIADLIFNKINNKPHNYLDMNNFIDNCINFSSNIIKLIYDIEEKMNEGCNPFLNNEVNHKICYYINKFIEDNLSINYLKNNNVMYDLYTKLNNCLKYDYHVTDFQSNDFLYSNIHLTWTGIKKKLKIYIDKKNDEYNFQHKKIKNDLFSLIKHLFKEIFQIETEQSTNNQLCIETEQSTNNQLCIETEQFTNQFLIEYL
jgi:hypothetical protein